MAEKKNDFREKFTEMLAMDVNEHTEKLQQGATSLTYLSWVYAIAEATKADPDMEYEIEMHDGKPYIYDELTGYLVTTKVTMFGKTKMMWLPVMDSSNKSMKSHAYEIQTKSRTITVQPATMFDINKTIMRCLTKNFAMFGLGLYIYAGEDLPREMQNAEEKAKVYSDRLTTALQELASATSRKDMNDIWGRYSDLQQDATFVNEIKAVAQKFPREQAA